MAFNEDPHTWKALHIQQILQICYMNYTSQQPHEIDIITLPILWMKKLRPRGSNLTKVLEIRQYTNL